jgi:NitT/TauT family transport system substrate-binding protein
MTRLARLPLLARHLLLAAAVLLGLALPWPAGGLAQQKPLRPYTLILDFVPTGEYIPHYTALEKGYYREEGLDVKILRGQGSGDTIKRIAAGQGEVGIADISALIAARANTDVTVKAIALWYRRPPHGVFVRSDSPIKTSKELEGKKLAISPGNSHQILWPVFEKLSGLKPGSVTWVTMDAASMPPALIRGAVDAVPFFVVHEARIRKVARQQNADIRVLAAWADLGFDVASTSLVAREETIAKDPEGLKAFLRATLRGADYAFRDKHFDEGVGYVVKAHPEVDPEGAVGAAQVGARFVYAAEVTSGKMAVGQFDPAQLEKTRDLYTQYLELKRKVGLEEIYTNDLLPAKK